MLYLVLAILLNTAIFSLFKLFPKYKVDNLQALVVNYITCVITGSILLGEFPVNARSLAQPWLPWAALMGTMFISLFSLIAWRIGEDGLTTTTVANKLSLVVPVIFSVWLYDETMSAGEIAGVLIAFPAVYLTTRVKENVKPKSILFPALLFVGSGLLDTLVKYVEQTHLSDTRIQNEYTIHAFTMASTVGVLWILTQKVRNKIDLHWRNIIAGIILGVPNYFSIYFLIRLLNSDFLQSSAAIPVNNIGIVLLSALVAFLFFKEKISVQRGVGLILSIAAILLIALSDLYGG
jgi:drug/metabolite transporter (DMT)-like permease